MNATEVRAPREDEAPAIADLFNALARAYYGSAETREDEIRLWFSSPNVDRELDVRVAVTPHGSLLSYGDVAEQAERIWLDLREHPCVGDGSAAKAVLDALLPRAHELARERELDPVVLRSWAPSVAQPLKSMLEREGFEVVRRSYRMEIDLAEEPPEPQLGSGIRVRTFRPGDERAIFEAQNDGFADMWEYAPSPYDEWLHFMTNVSDFDPSLWFLAVEDDELVGLALCRPHEPGDAELGWVRVLAVRPGWRRRGIGLALLRHAFRELRARGRARAGLGVDGESTTGALELYERAGMRVVRYSDIYEKVLDQPPDS